MLLVAVAVVYLMFFHSQKAQEPTAEQNELTAPLISPTPMPDGSRGHTTPVAPVAHSQYKQAIDRAQEVRKQMEQRHAEADAAGD